MLRISTRSLLSERRRRSFVDSEVQGALLRHALFYWLCASLTFAFVVFVYRVLPAWFAGSESGGLWYHFQPFAIASAVLLPIAIHGANRLSNRFAGPMLRVRAALLQLAEGKNPRPMTFRRHDFWAEFADIINLLSIRQAHTATAATEAVAEENDDSNRAWDAPLDNDRDCDFALVSDASDRGAAKSTTDRTAVAEFR